MKFYFFAFYCCISDSLFCVFFVGHYFCFICQVIFLTDLHVCLVWSEFLLGVIVVVSARSPEKISRRSLEADGDPKQEERRKNFVLRKNEHMTKKSLFDWLIGLDTQLPLGVNKYSDSDFFPLAKITLCMVFSFSCMNESMKKASKSSWYFAFHVWVVSMVEE